MTLNPNGTEQECSAGSRSSPRCSSVDAELPRVQAVLEDSSFFSHYLPKLATPLGTSPDPNSVGLSDSVSVLTLLF